MRTRVLGALGLFALVASLVPFYWGFRRQVCPNLSSGGSCYPDPAMLVPGVVLAVTGVGLVAYARRQGRAGDGSRRDESASS